MGGEAQELVACDGYHGAVARVEVHAYGMVDDLEMLQVCGLCELVSTFHVDIIHQDVFLLSDELERAGTFHGVLGLLLVVGVFCPVARGERTSGGCLDAVAVSNRPGLLGSLLVGVNFAKSFAYALDIPVIGIDHIRAHLYASQIETPLEYPYLGVLVSGGHTVICRVDGYDDIDVLGTTIDDAIGEAFDKVAKFYNLGYPGGVVIDRLSKSGDSMAFLFPGPTLNRQEHPYDMSYSGLKTGVINQLDKFRNGDAPATPENIAASFQRAAVGILMKRVKAALKDTGLKRVSAGGGVAANSLLRSELKDLEKGGYTVTFPSLKLCTDNGAMVAGLAYRYLSDGFRDDVHLTASARVAAFKKG